MKVYFDAAFYRQYKKVDVRIQKSVDERIHIFRKNPLDSQLNNHLLREPYEGLRSIDVTADYRAVYQEIRTLYARRKQRQAALKDKKNWSEGTSLEILPLAKFCSSG